MKIARSAGNARERMGFRVRCSGCFETKPAVLLEEVKKHQLEGIVAKLKNSKYQSLVR